MFPPSYSCWSLVWLKIGVSFTVRDAHIFRFIVNTKVKNIPTRIDNSGEVSRRVNALIYVFVFLPGLKGVIIFSSHHHHHHRLYSPRWALASPERFRDHTQRRTTVGRTPLDEWRNDLYLTTHNTHNRQTSMPPVGFELTVSADERPQTYNLDRAVTGTGRLSST